MIGQNFILYFEFLSYLLDICRILYIKKRSMENMFEIYGLIV